MSTLTFHKTRAGREKILRLFKFTEHAKKRLRERSIWNNDVRQAFHYGQVLLYDGLLYFALACSGIPDGRDHILIDELEGVVVLLDPDTYKVVTVYRDPNAIPKIERKIKYWSRSHKSRKKGAKGVPQH